MESREWRVEGGGWRQEGVRRMEECILMVRSCAPCKAALRRHSKGALTADREQNGFPYPVSRYPGIPYPSIPYAYPRDTMLVSRTPLFLCQRRSVTCVFLDRAGL